MNKATEKPQHTGPLQGIRVLEVGQLLAGPFAGCILGYFGAEVIKVEPPGSGDPLRQWRELDAQGTSFWWRSLARNKKCVTADMPTEPWTGRIGSVAARPASTAPAGPHLINWGSSWIPFRGVSSGCWSVVAC